MILQKNGDIITAYQATAACGRDAARDMWGLSPSSGAQKERNALVGIAPANASPVQCGGTPSLQRLRSMRRARPPIGTNGTEKANAHPPHTPPQAQTACGRVKAPPLSVSTAAVLPPHSGNKNSPSQTETEHFYPQCGTKSVRSAPRAEREVVVSPLLTLNSPLLEKLPTAICTQSSAIRPRRSCRAR